MSDPRVRNLAKIMVNYSLKIKAGQQIHLTTSPLAEEFNLAFIEEVTKAGGHVFTSNAIPGANEVFLKNASNKQLDYVSPISKLIVDKFDGRMVVQASANTRELSGVDPKKAA
ncbi:MAG TPA: aminopeptidase, partial [Anaerolineales bacterium]|nr:aminopeptidase [Anaerolineales bacterium]